jgi:hypothetical protein
MLAGRLEEWAQDYKAQGMQKGMQRGEILALQKLLTERFGIIPSNYLEKIANASSVQIDAWLDQLLDVHSLNELFGSDSH